MPYRNKQMLRDANGDLIPQYWDVVEQNFKPLTGSGGANDVRLTGSIVEVARVSNVTVDSGERITIDKINDFPYKKLKVMFRTNPSTAKKTVRVESRSSVNNVVLNVVERESNSLYNIEVFEEYEFGGAVEIYFYNKSDAPFTLQVFILEGIL